MHYTLCYAVLYRKRACTHANNTLTNCAPTPTTHSQTRSSDSPAARLAGCAGAVDWVPYLCDPNLSSHHADLGVHGHSQRQPPQSGYVKRGPQRGYVKRCPHDVRTDAEHKGRKTGMQSAVRKANIVVLLLLPGLVRVLLKYMSALIRCGGGGGARLGAQASSARAWARGAGFPLACYPNPTLPPTQHLPLPLSLSLTLTP